MDSYSIFITSLLALIILYLLVKDKRASRGKQVLEDTAERKINTVRRDNAALRDLDTYSETLFTAHVEGKTRRFFLDVKKTSDQKKVLIISELEREIGGESGYSLVVFSNEIDKFKHELDRCYGYMKNSSRPLSLKYNRKRLGGI